MVLLHQVHGIVQKLARSNGISRANKRANNIICKTADSFMVAGDSESLFFWREAFNL
jgi:hypothetical protein